MLRHWLEGLKPMLTDMPLLKLGKPLCLVLGLLLLSSCRDSVPPKIEICILDGLGGGHCIEADGSQLYKAPSTMKNYWATSQPDEANFSSWCYDTTTAAVTPAMEQIREQALK
jgi:hypothetical protein